MDWCLYVCIVLVLCFLFPSTLLSHASNVQLELQYSVSSFVITPFRTVLGGQFTLRVLYAVLYPALVHGLSDVAMEGAGVWDSKGVRKYEILKKGKARKGKGKGGCLGCLFCFCAVCLMFP